MHFFVSNDNENENVTYVILGFPYLVIITDIFKNILEYI